MATKIVPVTKIVPQSTETSPIDDAIVPVTKIVPQSIPIDDVNQSNKEQTEEEKPLPPAQMKLQWAKVMLVLDVLNEEELKDAETIGRQRVLKCLQTNHLPPDLVLKILPMFIKFSKQTQDIYDEFDGEQELWDHKKQLKKDSIKRNKSRKKKEKNIDKKIDALFALFPDPDEEINTDQNKIEEQPKDVPEEIPEEIPKEPIGWFSDPKKEKERQILLQQFPIESSNRESWEEPPPYVELQLTTSNKWKPTTVCLDPKYEAGWDVLRAKEKRALEKALFALKNVVEALMSVFTDFLFNEKYWNEENSVYNALDAKAFINEREPILKIFRKLRQKESVVVMNAVNQYASRVYLEIFGYPSSIPDVVGDNVCQHVPKEYENTFNNCASEIQTVIRDANTLMKTLIHKNEDRYFTEIQNVEETNSTVSYSMYLFAKGYLIQNQFNVAIHNIVEKIHGVTFIAGKRKGSDHFDAKANEYRAEGVQEPVEQKITDIVRGCIVCNDHDGMIAAHLALSSSPLFEKKISKDRREDPSCRDVLQVVLFGKDVRFLCEIQFQFRDILPLKIFSHAASTIQIPQDKDFKEFSTLFDYPTEDMDKCSRDDVKCKLDF